MIGYTLENFPFAAYHDIDVKETPELPSKHHYFLLPPIVPGFALYDKTWSKFAVNIAYFFAITGSLINMRQKTSRCLDTCF